ncbi:hypothetical protein J1605_008134 [Eschrichtius robustus]|uniref:Uncharacterized protein n=1 Tax=Eschrichtius robustus TaxID=9764 RepID=A0AB34GZA0_ESCRO|nr:hypothetical protein J1605_008134 [Eschrichtius robustus]
MTEGRSRRRRGPAPSPAPPLRAACASSFRVVLGRACRCAAARSLGVAPAPRPPRAGWLLVEPTARASTGPCRVRPFLYFSLLRVSVFLFRCWGWAGPGRSRASGSPGVRQRFPPRPYRPRRPPALAGLAGDPANSLLASGAASLLDCLPGVRRRPVRAAQGCLHRGVGG